MATTTVLTTAGKAVLTLGLTSGTGPIAKYVGIGKGVHTAAVGDTALTTEITTGDWSGYARATGTGSQVTTSVTNDTYQVQASFTSPGTTDPLAITEAACFDASTSGNMCIESTFSAINMSVNDILTMKLQVQLT